MPHHSPGRARIGDGTPHLGRLVVPHGRDPDNHQVAVPVHDERRLVRGEAVGVDLAQRQAVDFQRDVAEPVTSEISNVSETRRHRARWGRVSR